MRSGSDEDAADGGERLGLGGEPQTELERDGQDPGARRTLGIAGARSPRTWAVLEEALQVLPGLTSGAGPTRFLTGRDNPHGLGQSLASDPP